MRFSGSSLLGKQGQICVAEYLKIMKRIFRLNFFCTDRVDIRLCSGTNKMGVSDEIWHLWPFEIGDVGYKHPHDSDHVEC